MASVREREGRFTGLYRDQAGHQRSAGTYKTKREALKAGWAAEALEAKGWNARDEMFPAEIYPVERRGKTTVAGYGDTWLAGHRLEATSRASYGQMLQHIYRGLGDVPLRDLSPAMVRAFFRKLEAESKLSGGTIGLMMTTLRMMCQTAVQDGLMAKDPTAGIKVAGKRAAEMVILEPAEYRRLLDAIPDHYRLIVRALIGTGLRWGELMGLKASDIKDGQLTVRRVLIEVNAKTSVRDYGKTARAQRTITIGADLARDLTEAGQRDPEGWCVRAARGGPLTRANFRRVWKKALADAGIDKGVRVHDLRHTHASWLVHNGADLVSVRDRLGHSSISITSRYLHTLKRDTDPCLTALDRALAA